MSAKTANLMLFFCSISLLITKSHQFDDNYLGDGGVSADKIVSDLQSGNRGIFAVGYVYGKLTLLVSGPGDHQSSAGGYQVTVEEAPDGLFKLTNTPVPVPASVPSEASVKFICKDSTGDYLVTMGSSEVGIAKLPSGQYVKTKVYKEDLSSCSQSGKLHLSLNEAVNYYARSQNDGSFRKYQFHPIESIKTSWTCNTAGNTLGHLCMNGDSIFFQDKCGANVPSGIISGFVGPQNTYLFDNLNTVYVFDSTVFTSKKSAKLTIRSKAEAFAGNAKPNTATVLIESTTTESTIPMLILGAFIFLLVISVLACILIYCCCYKCSGKKKDSSYPKDARKGFRSEGKGRGKARSMKGGRSKNSRKKLTSGSANRSSGKSKSKGFSSSRSKPR